MRVASLFALATLAACGPASHTDAVISGRTGDGTEYRFSSLAVTDEIGTDLAVTTVEGFPQTFSPTFVGHVKVNGQDVRGDFQMSTGSALVFGDLFAGPDVFVPTVKVNSVSIVVKNARLGSGGAFIDRVRFVGGDHPLEWTGTVDATFTPDTFEGGGEITVKGRFTMYNDCRGPSELGRRPRSASYHCGGYIGDSHVDPLPGDSSLAPPGTGPNGMQVPRTGTFPDRISDDGRRKPCPDELVGPYVDGEKWTYDVKSFTSGRGEPLPCAEEYGDNHVCGLSKDGVSAGGCTWKVDVISDAPNWIMVIGIANEGCALEGGRFCRSLIR